MGTVSHSAPTCHFYSGCGKAKPMKFNFSLICHHPQLEKAQKLWRKSASKVMVSKKRKMTSVLLLLLEARLAFPYSLFKKHTIGIQQYLNICLYNGMGERFNKGREKRGKGKGMQHNGLMVSKANSYCWLLKTHLGFCLKNRKTLMASPTGFKTNVLF